MKSSTRLESVIFQLTPTRTRYDLFILANGKKEKVASGLLNPFLSHLKTAEDQIAKGGYSIVLEPKADDDAMWFTKGTIERFVRFVSTPEILERVHTVESEIVQIEKAILIHGSNDNGLTTVNDHQAKPILRIEACTGSNPIPDTDEKAIVLYTPGSQPPETDGSVAQEGNPKVQLLKVLETRISVLQKEQGMAFARAAAAGFDIDHMTPLVSFAKCFGATRLMDACLKFLDLLKRKHESGQWLKLEAAADTPRKENLASNALGILHNEMGSEMALESNEKAGADASGGIRPPVNHQSPYGQQEYFPGQYHPYPPFPPWPMHMSPGAVPFYQGHPMQTPYYQNYSPNGSYYPPPYQAVENPHLDVGPRAGQKRQSVDGETVSDTLERDFIRVNSHDDLEEKETTHRGPGKKSGMSRRKRSGTVVVRNINFITSGQSDSSGRDSSSESENEIVKNDGNLLDKSPKMTDQDYSRLSKRKGSEAKHTADLLLYKDEAINADGGQWKAFQNCLLRDTEESTRAHSETMFAMEKNALVKRPQNTVNHDPLAFVERDGVELQGTRLTEFQRDVGDVSNFPRATSDEHSTFREDGPCHSGRLAIDVMHTGMNGRKISYINETDEYMIGGKESQSSFRTSSDLALHGYEAATDNLAYMADDSFILPFRSMSVSQVGSDGRALIDINNELPVRRRTSEDIRSSIGNEVNFEPNELRLLPERGSEKRTIGYDPALDYEKQFCNGDIASVDTKNMGSVADAKQGSKRTENDRKSRAVSETLNKKKSGGPIMKGKPLKTNPLEEARVRAERLRSYKADLQKLKKEKDEAEQRRIEALKMDRKKRIAARGSLTSGQPVLSSSSSRKSLPTKLSPISQKGSKFSDSEPGSSSPLQRSKIRTALFGATDSNVSKITKSSEVSHKTENKLTRSVPERKKEPIVFVPDSKASMARIRRLSEPKTISSHPASSSVRIRRFSEPKTTISTAGPGPKVTATDVVEDKNISAIVNLDPGKTSPHPELMTEPSKGTSKVNQRKSAVKEMTLENIRRKSFVTAESDKSNKIDDRLSHCDLDDDPVIEKTVVMLECQKPYVPVVIASEEKMRVTEKHNHNNGTGDTTLAAPERMAVHATTSPIDRVQNEPTTVRSLELPISHEVTTNIEENKSANLPSTTACEESNQVPFAHLSSLEDSSIGSVSVETRKPQYSGFKSRKLEETPGTFEKPRVKEPSKGFRRLLKLGRKNHYPPAGEEIAASDNASGSEPCEFGTKADSTSEVLTLKNLMSKDETPTASTTPQKSSRHFSLLSSFRSKTSDKKLKT